jgi:hypothetical protein
MSRWRSCRCVSLLVWMCLFACGSAVAEQGPPGLLPTLGSIERLDPRFDALVPRDAVIEVLAGGFAWAEGPVWLEGEQAVLFQSCSARDLRHGQMTIPEMSYWQGDSHGRQASQEDP